MTITHFIKLVKCDDANVDYHHDKRKTSVEYLGFISFARSTPEISSHFQPTRLVWVVHVQARQKLYYLVCDKNS